MKQLILCIFLIFSIVLFAQKSKQNNKSESIGMVKNGSLRKGVRLPYKHKNFTYFSPFSYLIGRANVNSKVYRTVLKAYEVCEKTCPKQKFRVMECSRKKGGKMLPHRTHQNGLSIDFMTPLMRKGKQFKRLNGIGIWHYLLQFNSKAQLKTNKKVSIDYETMAKHLLALDDAAKKEGLIITKVILKIELQPYLFQNKYGKQLKRRGIYFVKALPSIIDNLHDEHYHVDFVER